VGKHIQPSNASDPSLSTGWAPRLSASSHVTAGRSDPAPHEQLPRRRPTASAQHSLSSQQLSLTPVSPAMEAGGGGQLFSVDPLERQAARGHGVVTSMAAGSDVIVLGTSRGWLVRHDFSFEDAHGKSPLSLFRKASPHRPAPADLDLGSGRSGDHSVHRVFLDPGGKHCVATVVHPGGAETYYHHARWPRPKLLPRLRGLLVNAVAWNRQSITEGNSRSLPLDSIIIYWKIHFIVDRLILVLQHQPRRLSWVLRAAKSLRWPWTRLTKGRSM
jgi:hypothetical protein